MEQPDITMKGYVDLYNPYRINRDKWKEISWIHQWHSDDFQMKLTSVYFIDDNGEYIDFNVTYDR